MDFITTSKAPGLPAGFTSARVSGDAFAPRYLAGDVLAFGPAQDPAGLAGQDAAVTFSTGMVVLARLLPTAVPGLWDLARVAAPGELMARGVRVPRARPVRHVARAPAEPRVAPASPAARPMRRQ